MAENSDGDGESRGVAATHSRVVAQQKAPSSQSKDSQRVCIVYK